MSYAKDEMDTPEKKLRGGYLKIHTYKEACKNWWDGTTEENRDIIKSMPNFDAKVFFDITGIDVRRGDKHGEQ